MNTNTLIALERFLRSVPLAVCRCSLRERDSGHHIDCRYEEVEEHVNALVHALNYDETLVVTLEEK